MSQSKKDIQEAVLSFCNDPATSFTEYNQHSVKSVDYLSWAAEALEQYFSSNPDNPFHASKPEATFDENKRGESLGHGGINREEHIQREMIKTSDFINRFGQTRDFEHTIHAHGKGIDIVSTDKNGRTFCFELKGPSSQDSVLHAALEIGYYLACLAKEPQHDLKFDHAVKVIIMPKGSIPLQEYERQKENLKHLFATYFSPLWIMWYERRSDEHYVFEDEKEIDKY